MVRGPVAEVTVGETGSPRYGLLTVGEIIETPPFRRRAGLLIAGGAAPGGAAQGEVACSGGVGSRGSRINRTLFVLFLFGHGEVEYRGQEGHCSRAHQGDQRAGADG